MSIRNLYSVKLLFSNSNSGEKNGKKRQVSKIVIFSWRVLLLLLFFFLTKKICILSAGGPGIDLDLEYSHHWRKTLAGSFLLGESTDPRAV